MVYRTEQELMLAKLLHDTTSFKQNRYMYINILLTPPTFPYHWGELQFFLLTPGKQAVEQVFYSISFVANGAEFLVRMWNAVEKC